MHALKGAIPRAYRDHRTRAGRTFGAYVRALVERFGALPSDVLPVVREAGRLVVDLEQLGADLSAALQARRRRDASRCRRQQTIARTQLVTLERHLEERLAHRTRRTNPLDAVRKAVEKANGR